MPELTPGKPITVPTPELLVENKLAAGRYRFQLVVIDEAGLESAPAELVVNVLAPVQPETVRPTRPVLRPDVIERPTIGTLRPDLLRPIRRPQ